MTLEGGLSPGGVEYAGRIAVVEGQAADAGLLPGDELLAVNDHPVRDIIDVQFYAAEQEVELLIRRGGELWLFELEREYGEPLGLDFEHPTFDIDIRRCNNQCLFCFVTQMAPRGFRRSLAIKDDDYRYSFLEGNYVTLTNLNESDWERIAEQHLSPLYVSVHATEEGLRRHLLRNPEAPGIMSQLRRLAEARIEVHTQLVIVPGLNDGDEMARSVGDLASLWPAVQSISVVPVGLTRYHRHGLRTNTPAEAEAVLEAVEGWQESFLERMGNRFVYATDEWYLLVDRPVPPRRHYFHLEALQENGLGLVREFLDDWEAIRSELELHPQGSEPGPSAEARSLTLVTGSLFAPILQAAAAELASLAGVPVAVQPVTNTTLGETITVAGLLMGRDVVEQLNGAELNDQIVLPEVMFRGPEGVTLDGMTPDEIAAGVGRPVTLAAGMEHVVALFAHSPDF